MPQVLAQLVFDPVARGAHYEIYVDDTTEDLIWCLEFWAAIARPHKSEVFDLIAAVLALHCL